MSLNWKWIALGVLIMAGLSVIVGLIATALLGDDLPAAAEGGEVVLTRGQMILAGVLNFLIFAVGGYIVGVRSTGRTILEPGLSALIGVALILLVAGSFTVEALLYAGLLPFVAGLLGGWLGERRQGTVPRGQGTG